MSIDKEKLKALAEAFPSDLDWGSNTVPFSQHPDRSVIGGESDGTYTVYGKPFLIDSDDYEYDGPTYIDRCGADFAEFMVTARESVLALLAEIEALRESATFRAVQSLRTDCEALRKDAERYRWLRAQFGVTKLPCAISASLVARPTWQTARRVSMLLSMQPWPRRCSHDRLRGRHERNVRAHDNVPYVRRQYRGTAGHGRQDRHTAEVDPEGRHHP